jgi:serine/threonine protein phosphatase PrpC
VVSTPAHGGWLPAWHCSVIGAAHRRRGVVCQDFSLVRQLRAPAGDHLQLLAVADGHGGEHYRYSETGSRLACEQAAAAVQAALQSTPLNDQHTWRRLLAEDLPQAIQARWLGAIERHWQQRPPGEREPFCSSLYGSTLGLLLLAPSWWGCTGLGDWDLVRVGNGGCHLLSEEGQQQGAGEATASLCLREARRRWAERARLQAIAGSCATFSLLISTDGVRKSCATDADFLELCCQLVDIRDSGQLAQGLAEISAGGSGDDLSIAVGSWCPSAVGHPPPGRSVPLAIQWLLPVGLAVGAAAWALSHPSWSWLVPGRVPAGPPSPVPAIQREAERLCRNPQLIAATLSQRNRRFPQLRTAPGDRQKLLATVDQDPLGALIAWSQPPSRPPQTGPPSPAETPVPLPGSCPALDQALEGYWRAQRPPATPRQQEGAPWGAP